MADMMQFDLVSPERKLASGQVRAVQIPGADGDLTAMPEHAATITTLRPGVLTSEGPEGETRFVVTGGFAEITPQGTSVLAERAFPADAEGRAALDVILQEMRSKAANNSGPDKDALDKAADDLERAIASIS
ncbi:F0F1 ATP synthase subunit epsilon [Roseinatronobacter bogoriensis]|uniref:ATP synthase epsilon chain n=1 Tax=Roseinatronobacter bogoriensis subsp. barguzinensis TaxID=441209 RepID=A0A2K8K9C7_9RHOB|nr:MULTISPECIES: F0F1 ATP synthase subunit epsilon [Rhodobaca]ATX66061.1 ATP synthase F1 subunit epsilon [Rhodobaca barguzinensis]MBB4207936.1 F-type H+-transporting ATPase subunit epsilon [Rhodobaca bogoriensis DSM 18756]TDW38575.1 ATP synthase F1 subcomplex epsilon subunit [Rhodobaca barguzinensis]TDY69386.1 ATP synthase F1 subcomplex epsilon subunit [Rhodobaca bogoriensis DSM 18756]